MCRNNENKKIKFFSDDHDPRYTFYGKIFLIIASSFRCDEGVESTFRGPDDFDDSWRKKVEKSRALQSNKIRRRALA